MFGDHIFLPDDTAPVDGATNGISNFGRLPNYRRDSPHLLFLLLASFSDARPFCHTFSIRDRIGVRLGSTRSEEALGKWEMEYGSKHRE